jgi:diphthine-ammonia ligase
MVDAGLHSIIIKVACLGLSAKHLGRSIADLEPVMLSLAEKYGCNVCGEGGEYETLTLDGPMFPFGRIELTVRLPYTPPQVCHRLRELLWHCSDECSA